MDTNTTKGKLIIISAPSGCGKSTIISRLMTHSELRLAFSISCTSRQPRGTERDGVEYFFLSPEEFRERIERGEFLEYEEVYKDRFYGTLRSQVEQQLAKGDNVVLDVDVKGGRNIKQVYGNQALSIFIQPPSLDVLRQRLLHRGTDSAEVIEQRLERATFELTYAKYFDAVVVNDDLDTAANELISKVITFVNQKSLFDHAKGYLWGCERIPLGMRKDTFCKPKGNYTDNQHITICRRVCLFGGSFNPIHNGHLSIARAALSTKQVDEVWFMVSPQNPFKINQTLLDDEKRLQMVAAAIADEAQMQPCDYEFRLPRPSYTWHTLQAMERDYPDTTFSLLIGGDNWAKFSGWYHAADILARYAIMVYPRIDSDIDASSLPPNVTLLNTPLHNISSTAVREKLLRGEDVSTLLPPQIIPLAREYYRQ